MTTLTEPDRLTISAEAQRTPECPPELSKAQLKAVIDALDDWWEATGAALANAAIPQPQRGAMNARQKAFLFQRVLGKKYKGL